MKAYIDVSISREQLIALYERFSDNSSLDRLSFTLKTDLLSIRFDSRYRDVISGHGCTDSVELVTAVLKTSSTLDNEDVSAEYDEPLNFVSRGFSDV